MSNLTQPHSTLCVGDFKPIRYLRLADMCDDLNRSHASGGTFYSRMDALKTVQLLIVDNFMTTPIATQNAVGLFECVRQGLATAIPSAADRSFTLSRPPFRALPTAQA